MELLELVQTVAPGKGFFLEIITTVCGCLELLFPADQLMSRGESVCRCRSVPLSPTHPPQSRNAMNVVSNVHNTNLHNCRIHGPWVGRDWHGMPTFPGDGGGGAADALCTPESPSSSLVVPTHFIGGLVTTPHQGPPGQRDGVTADPPAVLPTLETAPFQSSFCCLPMTWRGGRGGRLN